MAKLTRVSEYLLGLSTEAKQRYECKVVAAGLTEDPYVIESWTRDPEKLPRLARSDVVIYMVSTPSPHTKEVMKVSCQLYVFGSHTCTD